MTPAEVIADPGILYAAPIATADPTGYADLATLPSAWREVGYTEEGSTFTYDVSNEPIEVAEELDPVKYAVTKRAGKVSFAMAQASRRNIALALNLGAAAVNDGTTLEPPDPSAFLRVKLLWVSNDENSARGVLFRKCLSVGTSEVSRKKAPNKTLIMVEFALEKPVGDEAFAYLPNSSGLI